MMLNDVGRALNYLLFIKVRVKKIMMMMMMTMMMIIILYTCDSCLISARFLFVCINIIDPVCVCVCVCVCYIVLYCL